MSIATKPPAEVPIDAALIRALLQEQHAELAHLVLTDLGEGWDNHLFRPGDELQPASGFAGRARADRKPGPRVQEKGPT